MRMGLLVRLSHAFQCEMGVDLRRRETRMAQKLLHCPEFSAAIQQMGGERVAQEMRVYPAHTGTARPRGHDALYAPRAQSPSSSATRE
jgi:hypothetical protein